MKDLLKQLINLTDKSEEDFNYRVVPVENFEEVILLLFFIIPNFQHTKRYNYHAYDYEVDNELITWAEKERPTFINIDLEYIEGFLCKTKNS